MQKHTFTKFLIALSTVFSTFVLAQSASADTINLTWNPNPEPQVIGYKVHMGTQSGTYTQHIDVGPTTTWSFTSPVAGQMYCFVVTAYIAGPLEGARSTEACGWGNAPPTLANPGTQSAKIGQAASLQLVGSDPKGDVLTYSATGLPPGLTLMASTGYISGTPTTVIQRVLVRHGISHDKITLLAEDIRDAVHDLTHGSPTPTQSFHH